MSPQDTDKIIEKLVQDLTPVKVLPHPFYRLIPFLGLCTAYIGSLSLYMGVRADLTAQFSNVYFITDISFAAFIGLTATLSAFWLCIPDMRGQRWMPLISIGAFALFLLYSLARWVIEAESLPSPSSHLFGHCTYEGLLMGAVPAFSLMILIRKGATTRPVLMSAMSLLAIASFAYMALRFTCAADHLSHVGIQHVLPFVFTGAVLGTLARRVYNW